MRVALVSPYSWTVPGGVTRHVGALAETLLARGHDVFVLSPWDEPRGSAAERPPWLVPLGRTLALPFNGARSNLALRPGAGAAVLRELAAFGPDVVHLHEPVAPHVCWRALDYDGAPLVGTFHTYGTSRMTHGFAALCGSLRRMARLRVRIAVSEAAAWTGRSFYGGAYRVIPNGVHVPPAAAHRAAGGSPGAAAGAEDRLTGGGPAAPSSLRVVAVGRPDARKGLPVLLRAFATLSGELPGATLELVGADGPVSEAAKAAALARADVLVAPALGGESFGMVLTEAFAAGLPVVASDIPGYRAVARDGVEGRLVAPGDPDALAGALRDLALDPVRRAAMAAAARRRAEDFAWPRVAEQVEAAYEDALATSSCETPEPAGWARARRLPAPLEPLEPPVPRERAKVRRGLVALAAVALVAGAGLALERAGIGADSLLAAITGSSPGWTLAALGLMAASLGLRALGWRALLAAALPGRAVPVGAVYRATAAGVLMSATLPARLGEPARAYLVARSLAALPSPGTTRDPAGAAPWSGCARSLPAAVPSPGAGATLPPVVGTIVAQTAVNGLALVLLAAVVLSGAAPWAGGAAALLGLAVPLGAVAAGTLLLPRLLRGDGNGRASRRRLDGLREQLAGPAVRLRGGVVALADPRLGPAAVAAQLAAWALQWLACWALLAAVGIGAGPAAAAGVLLAVNVAGVVPLTPSNVGVFQAACVAVLAAHGVPAAEALAYGIVLQAAELAVAVVLGVPAMVREGLGWRQVRDRAVTGAARPAGAPR